MSDTAARYELNRTGFLLFRNHADKRLNFCFCLRTDSLLTCRKDSVAQAQVVSQSALMQPTSCNIPVPLTVVKPAKLPTTGPFQGVMAGIRRCIRVAARITDGGEAVIC